MKAISREGFIEEIGTGHGELKLPFGIHLKETPDELHITNGLPYAWIFSLFTGYEQLGIYRVNRPHGFKERMKVGIKIKDDKIVWVGT